MLKMNLKAKKATPSIHVLTLQLNFSLHNCFFLWIHIDPFWEGIQHGKSKKYIAILYLLFGRLFDDYDLTRGGSSESLFEKQISLWCQVIMYPRGFWNYRCFHNKFVSGYKMYHRCGNARK
jgi:hypothetical protein